MDHDRVEVSGSELIRWLVVAALILGGIGLFFYFAPTTRPVMPPSVSEPGR
ncbi:MAG: hypothetical protein ABI703_10745 [Gemmatimonadales bacterium]